MSNKAVNEGYVEFEGFKTWYKTVGKTNSGKYPLLCLHGGPNFTHDYLDPLSKIAETGRQIIFYDQLGSGNSELPDRPFEWKIPLFIKEIKNIRRELNLNEIHLFGQSWGGMLALEYVLDKPAGIKSLILADSLSSAPLWGKETSKLLNELPEEYQEVIRKHENGMDVNHAKYEEAIMAYYKKFVCRLEPWPKCLMKSLEKFSKNHEAYNEMWGNSEFEVNGTLKNWDVTNRLGEIDVPTLIISGRYDESTPVVSGTLTQGIRNSKWVLFDNSAHMPHLEEKEKYLALLLDFLDSVENQQR
ncbi:MAG: proline iminopeptidase-family hydrolase [Kosmotogaceae bacterium]